MKKAGQEVAQLVPAAGGWRLWRGGNPREGETIDAVLALAPEPAPVHLALPAHTVLLERLVLPSTERDELAGMVELQLEKTLPYPVEETVWDFQVLGTPEEGQSTVVTMAVHQPLLDDLCAPLRAHGRLPVSASVYAHQLAALAPAGEVALLFWEELGQLVAAVVEQEKLSWFQVISSTDAAMLEGELPVLLLSAEMQGAGTQFTHVLLAPECAGLGETIGTILRGVPQITLQLESAPPLAPLKLLPPHWAAESGRAERRERLMQRLLLGAVVYMVLLAAAFVYLAWRKHHLQGIEAKIARTKPLIEATQARQARWEALTPALEPSRSAVSILYVVYRNLPTEEVRITVFDFAPAQFMVEGEAPSAALAIDFAERLRKEPELSAFTIEAGPPQILPNEHAQYRIFGKLQ